MPYKIYVDKESVEADDPKFFLDINQDSIEYIYDTTVPVDICTSKKDNDKVDAKLYINSEHAFHAYPDQYNIICDQIKKWPSNTVFLWVGFKRGCNNKQIVYWDMCFNRTKAYYEQYSFNPDTQKNMFKHQTQFLLPQLKPADNKQKIFIAPCQTNCQNFMPDGYITRRQMILDTLMPKHSDKGYIGNYNKNPDLFLYSHIDQLWIDDYDAETLEKESRPPSYDWWGYAPPHNAYFTNTFLSIYAESVEYGSTIIVTEKTYDPLIKGHFILPYSTYGFVEHLKSIGIRFPDFIDYSYDQVVDNNLRTKMYLEEIKRLCDIDLDTWKQYWNDNFDIIQHNKRWFSNRPYQRLDLEQLIAMQG